MVGYIYKITNIQTGKYYVGITEDFERRRKKHISELNNNTHHSPKLQNAWNYWGQNNFEWTMREVEINNYDELYQLEIEEIKKFNSYEDGYNCNSGGKISDWKQTVKNEDVIKFLCVLEYYGDGYGKTFEQIFNWAKGTASTIKRRTRYVDAICQYEQMSPQSRRELADATYINFNIGQIMQQRQMAQGGCAKAYTLTQDDYNFAFAAEELGYGYTPVATFLGVKPATVKDWFNGRSRKREYNKYQSLSDVEKAKIKDNVQLQHLGALGHDKFINKKEKDVISFLCYDELYPQNDMVIQRLFKWSDGTCYSIRQESHYPITKEKIKLLPQEEKKYIADQLNLLIGRVKTAELSGEPKSKTSN